MLLKLKETNISAEHISNICKCEVRVFARDGMIMQCCLCFVVYGFNSVCSLSL